MEKWDETWEEEIENSFPRCPVDRVVGSKVIIPLRQPGLFKREKKKGCEIRYATPRHADPDRQYLATNSR